MPPSPQLQTTNQVFSLHTSSMRFTLERCTAAYAILVSMATGKPFGPHSSHHAVIFGSAQHAGSKYGDQRTGSRRAAASDQICAPVYYKKFSSETMAAVGFCCQTFQTLKVLGLLFRLSATGSEVSVDLHI
ncbi:hypothetical protein XENOCAPTIV_027886 [Xenoophorus captivus]|uniref:Uncharacterized protein n=1 Tax=Xenoophorus captivus TaxID=1517983 RepID=A0ABV0QUC4_9TELE